MHASRLAAAWRGPTHASGQASGPAWKLPLTTSDAYLTFPPPNRLA